MSNNDADKIQHSGRTGEFDISDMSDEDAEKMRARKRDAQLKDESGWGSWDNNTSNSWGGKKGGGPKSAPGAWGADAHWTGDKPAEAAKPPSGGNRTEAFFIGDGIDTSNDNALELKPDNRKYKIGSDKGGKGAKGGPRPSKIGWGDDWDDDAEGGSGSTMALNLDKAQAAAKGGGGLSYQRDAYKPGQDDDNSTYRAGHFKKLNNRDEDVEPPIGQRPSSPRGFGADFDDDGGGWSPSKIVDEAAAKIPKIPPKGGDSTAAIDVATFLGEDKKAAQQIAAESSRGHLIIFAPDSADSVVFEIRRNSISIGRDFSNDVVLSDPYTSQKHVIVHKRGAAYEVEDAGTVNGTTVNGHPITRARLQHGDHIEIGATILRFIPGTPSDRDKIPSSAPQRPPFYTAPPPNAGGSSQRSPLMLILVATLIMFLIAAGIIAVLWVSME